MRNRPCFAVRIFRLDLIILPSGSIMTEADELREADSDHYLLEVKKAEIFGRDIVGRGTVDRRTTYSK